MKSFKREVQNILNEQRLLKEKMNSLLVCRICLTILTDQYLEITTTTFQDKTLLQLIEIVGLVAVELLEPRHVCIKCSQNLCNFYLFRKLIKSTEENLKHKQLAIIEEEGKTKCCFVDDLDEPQDDSVATTESTEPSTEYETVNIQTGLEEVTLEIKVEDEDSMDECDDNILVDSYENELETFSPAVKGEVGLETVDSYPFSPSGSQATDDEDSKQEENSDQQTNDDKLKHKCKLCDCKFQRINELWDHEKSNHADEKLKCDDCGKLFITSSTYTCSYIDCGKTVRNTPGLTKRFFPVKNEKLTKEWILRSGNVSLSTLDQSDLKKRFICQDHFPKEVKQLRKLPIGTLPIHYSERGLTFNKSSSPRKYPAKGLSTSNEESNLIKGVKRKAFESNTEDVKMRLKEK